MAKIIFFSPHSFIWSHAFPEGIVAESLLKSGHDIVYITCGEALNSACICLSLAEIQSDSASSQRAQVCHQCNSRAQLIRGKMKLPGYSLSSIAKTEDDEKVSSVLANVSPSNFSELILEGVPIGRISAYEFLIKRKKMNTEFLGKEWQQYYSILKSATKAFYILKRIFDKEKPDYAICYNSIYSVNAVFTQLARENGVIPYFMHGGLNLSNVYQRLIIGRNSQLFYYRESISRWPLIKNVPCNKGMLSDVTEHFLELLRGRNIFAYSAPKAKAYIDMRNNFGILTGQKIIVATMSSYDEQFAAEFVGAFPKTEKLLFKTQADWIQALVKWIKDKQEYFLIVRVHPREFPNKRELVKSEHAGILQKLFIDFPKNVRVNWPEDGLSIYDLACEADVFLNAWSSVGQEMSLLGLPVVLYSKDLIAYPSDLNYLGETENLYFDQIEQALKDGWSFERVRQTYRWFALTFGRSQIKINDSYAGPVTSAADKNVFHRKFDSGLRRVFPLMQEWQDCQRRSSHLKSSQVINRIFTEGSKISFDSVNFESGTVPTIDQETAYLRFEMERIAKVMWGGVDKDQAGQNGKLLLNFRKYLTS